MPAPDFNCLYEHENWLEAAFETWLNSNAALKLFGSQKVDAVAGSGGAADDYQKDRPRVECFATIGAPVGSPPHFVFDANGLRRENGWHATIKLGLITAPVEALQRAYRGAVRNIMHQADDVMTGQNPYLPYHEVTQCFSAPSSREVDASKGYFLTELNYNIIFAIQSNFAINGIPQ